MENNYTYDNLLYKLKVTFCFIILIHIWLYYIHKFKLTKNIENNFDYKSAIIIGIIQVVSLIPGVSRSGISITAARFLNFKRVDSAKISFLLSIPILGAVSLFGLKNLIFSENSYFTVSNLIACNEEYVLSV